MKKSILQNLILILLVSIYVSGSFGCADEKNKEKIVEDEAKYKLAMARAPATVGANPTLDLFELIASNIQVYWEFHSSRFPAICKDSGSGDQADVALFYNPGGADIKFLTDYARSKGLEIAFGLDLAPDRQDYVGSNDVDGLGNGTFDEGVCDSASGGPLVADTDRHFGNSVIVNALKEEAKYIARELKPNYFAFGVEIQAYLRLSDATKRTDFWTAFDEIKTAVMSEAAAAGIPGMKFFVYYHYEAVALYDIWPIIQPNAEKSDLFGFSSYPISDGISALGESFGFCAGCLQPTFSGNGINFPSNYYDAITSNLGTNRPIAFLELGYGIDVSVADQNEWLGAYFNSLAGKDVELINWLTPHDFDWSSAYGGNTFFNKMGLRDYTTGDARPSWSSFISRSAGSAQ